MPRNPQIPQNSPLAVLTELAVEGASNFIEAQRIFLTLAQQENDLLLHGVKERVGGSASAAAMTDLVRHSLDTVFNMQQEFLTMTSKETMRWLETVQSGKSYQSSQIAELAQSAMKNFVSAHHKLLDALRQGTLEATKREPEPVSTPGEKKEISTLAREAGNLFIEAQKQVLDVLGQQMNGNIQAASRVAEALSPSQIVTKIDLPAAVRDLLNRKEAPRESKRKSSQRPKAASVSKRGRRPVSKGSEAA